MCQKSAPVCARVCSLQGLRHDSFGRELESRALSKASPGKCCLGTSGCLQHAGASAFLTYCFKLSKFQLARGWSCLAVLAFAATGANLSVLGPRALTKRPPFPAPFCLVTVLSKPAFCAHCVFRPSQKDAVKTQCGSSSVIRAG